MKEKNIELKNIRFTDNRTYGGKGDMQILAEDIKLNGLINPITVKPMVELSDKTGVNTYEVVAGRRRTEAVTLLGWNNIPCRILEGAEIERAEEIAGAENINRLGMHPLDEAVIFQKLLEHGETIEELAKRFDRKISEIWQRIQLLELSDDIKSMFRAGFLSLQSAAMLNSLDEEGQALFFEKNFSVIEDFENGDQLSDYAVEAFISGLNNDILYKFIKDKQCVSCKNRTFYENKTLFPDLEDMNDVCLSHECYLQKWSKVLLAGIKAATKDINTHEAANTIVFNESNFRKILGKSITLNGTEYKIISWSYDIFDDKPKKGAQPCLSITFGSKLTFEPMFLKEKKIEKAISSSSAAGKECQTTKVVRLLNLPKDEEAAAVKALKEQKNFNFHAFEQSIQKKVFWQLIEEAAVNESSQKDVELYLNEEVFGSYMSDVDKKIFKIFTGQEYNKKIISDIIAMPKEILFSLLFALTTSAGDLPNPSDFNNDCKDNLFMKWVGINKDRLLKLYQEELKLLLPKQKAPVEKPTEKKAKNNL